MSIYKMGGGQSHPKMLKKTRGVSAFDRYYLHFLVNKTTVKLTLCSPDTGWLFRKKKKSWDKKGLGGGGGGGKGEVERNITWITLIYITSL